MNKGNVEIVLPQKEQVTICCSRVGTMEDGEFVLEEQYAGSGINLNILNTAKQLEKAAERLSDYIKNGFLVETSEEGIAKLQNLEEGVYLLNSLEMQGNQKMLPTLLYLPSWDEAEEKMMYDITIVPKYGTEPPKTGDSVHIGGWSVLLVLSAVIIGCKMKKSVKKEDCF